MYIDIKVLILLLAILLGGLLILDIKRREKNKKIKDLKVSLIDYRKEVSEKYEYIKALQLSAKEVDKRIGVLIGMYIHLLNSQVTMYVNSSFHSNYSFYNGKFYVKVNKKPTNNKAVSIPFIKDENSRHKVLNLTRLSTMITKDTANVFIDHLNTRNLERLIEIQQECTVHKEDVIKELGNKVLKMYK